MKTLLFQLADSAFPAGGFAHSLGLESLRQLGHLRGEEHLRMRLRELVWHTAWSALPFVSEAHAGDPLVADQRCHVFLSGHVAHRASKALGAAFALAAREIFGAHAITPLPHAHGAVVFGSVLARVTVSVDEARELFLFGALRGAISAAVRLSVVGPLRAQAILFSLHDELRAAMEATRDVLVDDAVSVSPLVDLCQGAHDRLYARLFQS